jgi:hypothetical protein
MDVAVCGVEVQVAGTLGFSSVTAADGLVGEEAGGRLLTNLDALVVEAESFDTNETRWHMVRALDTSAEPFNRTAYPLHLTRYSLTLHSLL